MDAGCQLGQGLLQFIQTALNNLEFIVVSPDSGADRRQAVQLTNGLGNRLRRSGVFTKQNIERRSCCAFKKQRPGAVYVRQGFDYAECMRVIDAAQRINCLKNLFTPIIVIQLGIHRPLHLSRLYSQLNG